MDYIYVVFVDLSTNSDHFPRQHEETDFYNRDDVCSLRSTSWVFTYNRGYSQSKGFKDDSWFDWQRFTNCYGYLLYTFRTTISQWKQVECNVNVNMEPVRRKSIFIFAAHSRK